MDIKRAGSQPSGKGPSDWFTGTVRIDRLFQATVCPSGCVCQAVRAPGSNVTLAPRLAPER
jgi:hypothetical protein